MADRTRLRQVVANLLDNALKYTGHGGRVDVHAERDVMSVLVTVKDTGIGMTLDELPKRHSAVEGEGVGRAPVGASGCRPTNEEEADEPAHGHIGRAIYFERGWPNSERVRAFTIEKLFWRAQEVGVP